MSVRVFNSGGDGGHDVNVTGRHQMKGEEDCSPHNGLVAVSVPLHLGDPRVGVCRRQRVQTAPV